MSEPKDAPSVTVGQIAARAKCSRNWIIELESMLGAEVKPVRVGTNSMRLYTEKQAAVIEDAANKRTPKHYIKSSEG